MADDKAQLVARNFLSHVHQLFYFIIYLTLLFYSIVKKYNKCLFFTNCKICSLAFTFKVTSVAHFQTPPQLQIFGDC